MRTGHLDGSSGSGVQAAPCAGGALCRRYPVPSVAWAMAKVRAMSSPYSAVLPNPLASSITAFDRSAAYYLCWCAAVQGWVTHRVTFFFKNHFSTLKSIQVCCPAPEYAVDGIRAQDRPFSCSWVSAAQIAFFSNSALVHEVAEMDRDRNEIECRLWSARSDQLGSFS